MRGEVLLDSSYLIAGFDRRDDRHADAMRLTRALHRTTTVTTDHVVGECWTYARRRFGHAAAVRLVDSIRSSRRCTIVTAGPEVERSALEWLRQRDECAYSFVDAVSFQVMADRDITEALTFDSDFLAAGFQPRLP